MFQTVEKVKLYAKRGIQQNGKLKNHNFSAQDYLFYHFGTCPGI